jgi:hypothetical protein
MTTSEMRDQFPELYAELFGDWKKEDMVRARGTPPGLKRVHVSHLPLDTSRLEAACAWNSEKTDRMLRGIDAVNLLAESLVQVHRDGKRKH